MAEHSGPLRLAVNHEKHLIALPYSTDADRTCCAARHSIAGKSALAYKQTRNLILQHRQERRLAALLYGRRRNGSNSERRKLYGGLIRSRHDNILKRDSIIQHALRSNGSHIPHAEHCQGANNDFIHTNFFLNFGCQAII